MAETDLTFATTPELIEELERRSTHMIFVATLKAGPLGVHYKFFGSWLGLNGLIRQMSLCFAKQFPETFVAPTPEEKSQ